MAAARSRGTIIEVSASHGKERRRARRRDGEAGGHPLQWNGSLHYAFRPRLLRALGAFELPASPPRPHRRRRRRRGVRAVRACAARRALRRVSAHRRVSRHADGDAVGPARPAGRDRLARRPAGTAGTRSSSSVACACRTARGASDVPLLELPEVDLIVAWTSLPLFELRLKELVIERPRLAIRRDRGGMLHVAGLEFDPTHAIERSAADRLDPAAAPDRDPRRARHLERRRCATRRSSCSIACNSVWRTASAAIASASRERRPRMSAAPLDIRGDIQGGSFKEWQKARGQIYVRLDYADVEAWREWLPLPAEIAAGKGALRVWFDFAAGDAREIVADLELADVKARLGEGLPELELAHLSGRVGWRGAPPEAGAVRARSRLRHRRRARASNRPISPCRCARRRRAARRAASSNSIACSCSRCASWRPSCRCLRAGAPISPVLRRAGRSRTAMRAGKDRPTRPPPSPRARSSPNLGIVAQDAIPGATGLSGSFDANEKGGELKLATRGASLELPRVFAGPIPFDSLQGALQLGPHGWAHTRRHPAPGVRQCADGRPCQRNLSHGGPGARRSRPYRAALARAIRARCTATCRLPRMKPTRDWLQRALTKGEVTDARLKLAGDLAQFPFADGKAGQFIVTAKAQRRHAGLRATHWPPIEAIDGEIRFEGASMAIDAARGRVFGAQIGQHARRHRRSARRPAAAHHRRERRRARCQISCASSRRARSTR